MSSATSPTRAAISRWNIDPAHSGVHFSVRHMMIANVRGEFGRVSGTLELDAADLSRSVVQATIDASSINTRESQRDDHLRSPDFLDAANYPTLDFRSTRIEPRGGDRLAVVGDLTIRGVTREVTLAVETDGVEHRDPFGNLRRGATATTTINRTDFGLGWNAVLETGGFLVGEDVKITIDVQLVPAAEQA